MNPRRRSNNGRVDGPLLAGAGRSGARMYLLESPDELRRLRDQPALWLPDNLLLLQEYFQWMRRGVSCGMEFLGAKISIRYACGVPRGVQSVPSEVCNSEDGGDTHCAFPEQAPTKPVEFHPYPEVPAQAVETGEKIMAAGGLTSAHQYLEADGRMIYYDVNANSNLRAPIGKAFGFDPFERVVDYLTQEIARAR
jgi:hypothetical protein